MGSVIRCNIYTSIVHTKRLCKDFCDISTHERQGVGKLVVEETVDLGAPLPAFACRSRRSDPESESPRPQQNLVAL